MIKKTVAAICLVTLINLSAALDLATGVQDGDPAAISRAAVDLATPAVIQAGLAVHELGHQPEYLGPACAPNIPCRPVKEGKPFTPPLTTLF